MRAITAVCDLADAAKTVAKALVFGSVALPVALALAAYHHLVPDPPREQTDVDTSRWWCGRCRRYVNMPHVHPVPREYRS